MKVTFYSYEIENAVNSAAESLSKDSLLRKRRIESKEEAIKQYGFENDTTRTFILKLLENLNIDIEAL